MAIVDRKKQVFGKIAALRTLTSGLPTLKKTSSFPSVNNNGDSILFLTDLIKAIVGYEELKNSINEVLLHSLPKIEVNIKNVLKQELKGIVSCGVDPHLPIWIKSSGTGIIIPIKKIDFMDMLRTDPNSIGGKLMYNDITSTLTDSSDFNTFLYGVIQDDGVTHTWQNILDVTFNSVGTGTIPNNTLTIKTNPSYDLKTLNDLNNDFVNSNMFLNTENILNKSIDLNFGSIASIVGKSLNQLQNEAKINTIIDKMVNNVNKNTLDDSAFSFTKEETYKHELDAINRKNGVSPLDLTGPQSAIPAVGLSTPLTASIASPYLTKFNDEMNLASNLTDKRNILSKNLDIFANTSASNVPNIGDISTVKLNFIQLLVNSLTKSIVSIFLSPKVMISFLINYKLVNGQNADYADPIDFIKKNKQLMNGIMKSISQEIIKILLAIALKKISELVADAVIKRQKEKSINRISQLESLAGVPTSQINNLLNSI